VTGVGCSTFNIADVVAKVGTTDGPKCFIAHFENQSQPDPDLPRRVYQYAHLIHMTYWLPVLPIAILTHDAPDTAVADSYGWSVAGRSVSDLRYDAVQLNRLRWRDPANTANPFAAMFLGKMGVAPHERVEAKVASVRQLARLATLNAGMTESKMELAMQVVDAYLPLDLAEHAAFRGQLGDLAPTESDMALKIVTSWEKWGRSEGLAEGRTEGLAEGRLETVLRQLARKVGALSPATQTRVRALKPARVQALADALLDFDSAADLAKWLKARR
jgi:hypothetical protein